MKALIIYTSVHRGSTEMVAKVIANVLNTDLLQLKQAATSMFEQHNIIGFGSGIYFGRHRRNLLNFIDMSPMIRNKKALIFSTSRLRKIPFIHDFDKPLREELRLKGFDIVGEFSCRGLDMYGATKLVGGLNRGRANAEDLGQARDFAKSLNNSGATNLQLLLSS